MNNQEAAKVAELRERQQEFIRKMGESVSGMWGPRAIHIVYDAFADALAILSEREAPDVQPMTLECRRCGRRLGDEHADWCNCATYSSAMHPSVQAHECRPAAAPAAMAAPAEKGPTGG